MMPHQAKIISRLKYGLASLLIFALCLIFWPDIQEAFYSIPVHFISEKDFQHAVTSSKTAKVTDDEKVFSNQIIPSNDLLDDMRLMIYTLDNGYAGKFRMDSKTYQKQRSKLLKLGYLSKKPLSRKQLIAEIKIILSTFPDKHLGVWNAKQTHWLLKKNRKKLPFNMVPHAWKFNTLALPNHKIPYIKLFYFPQKSNQQWNGFFKQVNLILHAHTPFLLDLRDNPGGDSAVGQRLFNLFLNGKQRFNKAPNALKQKISLVSKTANSIFCSSMPMQPDTCNIIEKAQKNKQEKRLAIMKLADPDDSSADVKKLKPYLWSTALTPDQPYYYDPEKGFNQTIYILINENCGSSCELFTLIMKAYYPFTVLVGQPTAGALHFGDVGFMLLPKTKILVQIPTSIFEWSLPVEEKKGINPDVWVNPKDDALETAKKLISKRLSCA
jgi:hypothetical protein